MQDQLERIYRFYAYKGRPFLKYAWKEIMNNMITVVEAPTGYGKTTLSQAFALYSLSEGFKQIISYPLRTLLEDQYRKFSHMTSKLSLKDVVGTRYMHHLDSYFFVKPITLTTVDTFSMTLFGLEPMDLEKAFSQYYGGSIHDSIIYSIGHYLFSRSSVLLSNIVLDEVHLLADSTKSLNFLASLIVIARQNGLRLVFMSATLPRALITTLRRIDRSIVVADFNEDLDPDFIGEREAKEIDYSPPVRIGSKTKYETIIQWLLEAEKKVRGNGLRAVLVFNTVNEAIEMYNRLLETDLRRKNIILLHSRFRENDRRSKTALLEKLTSILKERLRNHSNCSGIEYIVVSTQVIEAGVDISSNVFITDAAPANSLIQRLGRFLRYPGENRGFLRIWYDESIDDKGGRYKVYDKHLVKKTLDWLRAEHNFNPHIPSKYRDLLDGVYTTSDYIVSVSEVEELVSLTLQLRSPRRAVEKFIELGGSYIRNSVLVPVVPETQIAESIEEIEPIPLPIRSINKDLVKAVLVRDPTGYRRVDLSEYGLDKRRGFHYQLIRLLLRQEIAALIVRGTYDIERGLVIS
ncbi:MAG: CRISPR-associated helicase Cas3' [Crenarchaeota archaeon]|nr:CRISPR-associated helicase Cas3' [Thermoproteota archaeon]